MPMFLEPSSRVTNASGTRDRPQIARKVPGNNNPAEYYRFVLPLHHHHRLGPELASSHP